MTEIPLGLCQCGCGQTTLRWRQTQRTLGRVRGEPMRYVRGHTSRRRGYRAVDRGFRSLCWIWTGSLGPDGRPRTTRGGRMRLVYRIYYEEAHGPIPAGAVLDHLCGQPGCINPEHLEVVSQRENVLRQPRTRKTICARGHALVGENVFLSAGSRRCRLCSRINAATTMRRRRARQAGGA